MIQSLDIFGSCFVACTLSVALYAASGVRIGNNKFGRRGRKWSLPVLEP